MSEELGHHFTLARTNRLLPVQNTKDRCLIMLDEYKALLWAVNFLIPAPELVRVIQKNKDISIEELAVFFKVTMDYIQLKLELIANSNRYSNTHKEKPN